MEQKAWGMQFNEHSSYHHLKKGQRPLGSPEWMGRSQLSKLQEPGLIIWNNVDKKIEVLGGSEALKLLEELTSQDTWKSTGVSVTRLVHRLEIQLPPSDRRSKTQPEVPAESRKEEIVNEEILHLPPEAGPELIQLLQVKKQSLTEMAEQQQKRFRETLSQLYGHLIELGHKREMREFNFATRPITWQNKDTFHWVCQYESADGQVCLEKAKLFWITRVSRPGHQGKYQRFSKFVDAVEWVEKEIVELANQPQIPEPATLFLTPDQIETNRNKLKEKLRRGPYWIDPTVFEPRQLTFKVFIEMDAKPVSSRKLELEFGDTIEVEKQYPLPSQLTRTLGLDVDHFSIDKPIGEHSDWYRFTSLTTFFQEQSAADQAQKAWDQSRILQQFKSGNLVRARYGYQEVETDYIHYLGSCEDPEKPWPQHESRSAYMEEEALRETLCYALDVNDYRDFTGVSAEFFSDNDLMEIMHNRRVRSKHLPEDIRRASKIWLAEHEPLK
jgi:hypothetical protein